MTEYMELSSFMSTAVMAELSTCLLVWRLQIQWLASVSPEGEGWRWSDRQTGAATSIAHTTDRVGEGGEPTGGRPRYQTVNTKNKRATTIE